MLAFEEEQASFMRAFFYSFSYSICAVQSQEPWQRQVNLNFWIEQLVSQVFYSWAPYAKSE